MCYSQHYYIATAESTVQNGTIVFTDDATIQCIAVSLSSFSPNGECLSLSLSAASSVDGLTLSPSVTIICVISIEGNLLSVVYLLTHAYVYTS